MLENHIIKVVIPALNEAQALGPLLSAIPSWVDAVIVADNGSTDDTAAVARAHGATVVPEPNRGYGNACQAALANIDPCDIVVFMDGDFSDHPEEMPLLVQPIVNNQADLVIGSRIAGNHLPGSLTTCQRLGNALACSLIKLFWRQRFTDLGPFRAARLTAFRTLNVADPNFGWLIEMQIKAVRAGLRLLEVPVSYRPRIGQSKISHRPRAVIGAGAKIIGTILLYALTGAGQPKPQPQPLPPESNP